MAAPAGRAERCSYRTCALPLMYAVRSAPLRRHEHLDAAHCGALQLQQCKAQALTRSSVWVSPTPAMPVLLVAPDQHDPFVAPTLQPSEAARAMCVPCSCCAAACAMASIPTVRLADTAAWQRVSLFACGSTRTCYSLAGFLTTHSQLFGQTRHLI